MRLRGSRSDAHFLGLRSSARPQISLSLIFADMSAFGIQVSGMASPTGVDPVPASEDGNPILGNSCEEGRKKGRTKSPRMASPTAVDTVSASEDVNPILGKSCAEGSKIFRFPGASMKGGCKAPRFPLVYHLPTNYVKPSLIPQLVESSLSFLNAKSVSNQEPEYELVDTIGAYRGIFPVCYHLNFTARPKNENGAEEVKLFFAEIFVVDTEAKEFDLICSICCEVGPSGAKNGRFGCKICDLSPHVIQHPKSGFRKSVVFPDPIKKKKKRKRY